MATGTSITGKVVSAGDQVTIVGSVTAVSGSGPSATVTIQPLTGASTFNAKASDCYAPQGTGNATSLDGKPFGVGSQVSVPAAVTSVSGSGANATLTSTVNSGASVTHPANSVHAPHK